MLSKNKKRILLYVVLGLFWLPLLVRFIPIEDKELNGVTEPVKKPVADTDHWLTGDFQKQQEYYFSYQLGFRRMATRIANELDYRLGKQRSNVIVGKEYELMGKEYIDSYYGKDYIGDDSVQKIVKSIALFREELSKNGIAFFVVIAPSKTRLYPDRIPNEYREAVTDRTNYAQMLKELNAADIQVLNFQTWFESIDKDSPYALFSNLGLHWSNYAGTICADSLMGYIGNTTHKQVNRIRFTGAEPDYQATGTDRDMLDLMNLCFPVPLTKPLGKLKGTLQIDTTKFRPAVLAVGDSYYWNIIYSGIPDNCFKQGSAYYYYNSKAYFNNGATLPTKEVDVLKACLTKDVVFMLYAEPNLRKLGDGIDKQFLEAYSKEQGKRLQE